MNVIGKINQCLKCFFVISEFIDYIINFIASLASSLVLLPQKKKKLFRIEIEEKVNLAILKNGQIC